MNSGKKILLFYFLGLFIPLLSIEITIDKIDTDNKTQVDPTATRQIYDVDTSRNLEPEEVEYINRREQRTHAAISQFLNLEPASANTKLPRIAFVGSGGGFRASTCYISMLAALQSAGLYDCGSYAAGLSGGAWAILPLILRGLDPITYSAVLKQHLCQINHGAIGNILSKLKQSCFEENFVKHWGEIAADRLYGDIKNNHQVTFNDIRANLSKSNNFPYPICTVAIGESHPNYEFLEINPFRIHCSGLGGSIPTPLFGSIFNNGRLVEIKPEITLDIYLGMLGSAFSLSIGDILSNGTKMLFDTIQIDQILSITDHDKFISLTSEINGFFDKLGLNKSRFFPATIPNYSYQMNESKLKDSRTLGLFDAGAVINLPLPSLIRNNRNIDIYIICDSSSDSSDRDFTELRYAAEWARINNIKFPSLNKFKEVSPDMKIFYENDNTIPYVIYFSNQIDAPAVSLVYSPEIFDKLYSSMHITVLDGIHAIADALRRKMNIQNNFNSLPQGQATHSCCIIS